MKCTSNRGESSTAEFSETQSGGESDLHVGQFIPLSSSHRRDPGIEEQSIEYQCEGPIMELNETVYCVNNNKENSINFRHYNRIKKLMNICKIRRWIMKHQKAKANNHCEHEQ